MQPSKSKGRHRVPASGLEKCAAFFASTSVIATGYVVLLTIPNFGTGYYGGTALLITFILIGQVVTLGIGAAIPVILHVYRRHLRITSWVKEVLALAGVGIFLEIVFLVIIPITGGS